MIERSWRLPWKLERWVDGDTCHGVLDLGWGHLWKPPKGLRLLLWDGGSYDAPERRKPTFARGEEARVLATQLAPPDQWYMVTSHYVDPDDFGRILCSLELEDGQDLATVMIKAGYVK